MNPKNKRTAKPFFAVEQSARAYRAATLSQNIPHSPHGSSIRSTACSRHRLAALSKNLHAALHISRRKVLILLSNPQGGKIMKHVCKTGEKPGRGTYSCTRCHTQVSVGEYDKLPPCPSCSNNEFTEA